MPRYELTVYQTSGSATYISIDELSEECEVHPDFVRRMVDLGVVEPAEPDGELFEAAAAFRIDRLLRLRRDLGVNYEGAALIVELLDRIERLEARIRQLESV